MQRFILITSIALSFVLVSQTHAQTFTPNYSTNAGTGSSFQGMSFSGVGSAILNCTNIGSTISSAARDLFKSTDVGQTVSQAAYSITGINTTVPVKDDPLKKQAEKQAKKENCLDGIAYAMAKNTLQQVSNKTLNWVNTGFDGNPLYIRDIDSYLKSIRDQKLDSFLKQVPSNNPIFGNAIRSAITQQVTGYTDGRINRTMNTPQARAYQSFQQDFTQGGWNALLNPQNNPLSAYFDAVQQVSRDIDTAQQNVQNELVQGDGFLSMKKCVEWGVQTSGAATQNGTPLDEIPPDLVNTSAPTSAATPRDSQKCLKYETVTPGSIIAQQTAYITNSAVRQLEQADKINEVLGSFFDNLLNRLFANGLGSLSRGRGAVGVSTGMGTNVVLGTNGAALGSFADSSAQLGSLGATPTGFNGTLDISRPQQLRAMIKTQLDYVNRAKDAEVAMQRIVPTLGALDYCLPGPNPTWQSGLSDNFQTMLGSLQQPSASGPSALQGFLTSIPILGGLFGGNDSPPPVLSGAPVLYDKVTDSQRTISPQVYVSAAGIPMFPFSRIPEYITNSFNELVTDYTNAGFDSDTLANAYAALESGVFAQADARAFVKNAYKETGRLVSYNRNISEYAQQYSQNISDTEDAVEQLQAIYARIQQIVSGAKTRYVAQQSAAGTPVDATCINQAYVIDNTPIVPVARVESDAPNPFVIQSVNSSTYFYSNL